MNSALLAVNLNEKRHGPRTVLRDVAFSVGAGEIVALLGASGCGKSTLLRAIAGLDTDYDGNIQHSSGRTGFVFQEPRLMPWLNVADNVGFPLGHAKGGHPRVAELLDEVGLTHAAHFQPKQLSGGMAQRAAIARALVSRPDLLLLDEPFSALDVLTRGRLHRLVRDLVRKYRMGALLVTHDPDEALTLASRVLVLDSTPGPFREALQVPGGADDPTRLALREKIISALAQTHQEYVI
ncbi:MAG: ABC transporter ATP-binding protein [Burkholderiales bacterium]|nr:ABC transporter ATP-binding protein [Burkholderiales bacterium]